MISGTPRARSLLVHRERASAGTHGSRRLKNETKMTGSDGLATSWNLTNSLTK